MVIDYYRFFARAKFVFGKNFDGSLFIIFIMK